MSDIRAKIVKEAFGDILDHIDRTQGTDAYNNFMDDNLLGAAMHEVAIILLDVCKKKKVLKERDIVRVGIVHFKELYGGQLKDDALRFLTSKIFVECIRAELVTWKLKRV